MRVINVKIVTELETHVSSFLLLYAGTTFPNGKNKLTRLNDVNQVNVTVDSVGIFAPLAKTSINICLNKLF